MNNDKVLKLENFLCKLAYERGVELYPVLDFDRCCFNLFVKENENFIKKGEVDLFDLEKIYVINCVIGLFAYAERYGIFKEIDNNDSRTD